MNAAKSLEQTAKRTNTQHDLLGMHDQSSLFTLHIKVNIDRLLHS